MRVLFITAFIFFLLVAPPSLALSASALRSFLESQYVPEARLLRAATTAFPDNVTIWIASDNLLAARALATLGSPYASIVATELQRYGGGRDYLHEVLLGVDIPDEIRAPDVVVLGTVYSSKFNTTIAIKREIRNGTIMSDWKEYADLVAYRAIDELLEGSRPTAEELFEHLMSMWDGYGFRDKAFSGRYTTYKLALAIYLYRALRAAGSNVVYKYSNVIDKCYEIISKLQRSDGGIVTDYTVNDGNIVPTGDANTETASIVALAIYSNYPEIIGKRAARLGSRVDIFALFFPVINIAYFGISIGMVCALLSKLSRLVSAFGRS